MNSKVVDTLEQENIIALLYLIRLFFQFSVCLRSLCSSGNALGNILVANYSFVMNVFLSVVSLVISVHLTHATRWEHKASLL